MLYYSNTKSHILLIISTKERTVYESSSTIGSIDTSKSYGLYTINEQHNVEGPLEAISMLPVE